MRSSTVRRAVIFAAALLLFAAGGDAAIACQVSTMSWSTLTHGTMRVRSGQPCKIYFRSAGPIYQVQVTKRPSGGSVNVGSVNEITYQSRAGFTGSDTFSYARIGRNSLNRPLKAGFQIAVTVTP